MKTTQRVLELLTTTPSYLSGQEIADKLKLSRTAVWKAIKSLKEQGYDITSKPHVGYRYFENDTLNKTAILNALPADLELDLEIYATLPSTNLKAKELSLTAKNSRPLVIIADQQTAGYGRYQRPFVSPKDTGIYLSILLNNDQTDFDPGLLTTATAVCVTRTLKKLLNVEPTIKWVNDVLVDGKKVCGILTEGITDLETQALKQIIVGTGINFLTPLEAFSSELLERVGTLKEYVTQQKITRNQFIAEYLTQFFSLYQNYTDASFMVEYREASELIGKNVTLKRFNGQVEAKVLTIDDHGALVLDNGQTFNSGEVIKVRKA